MSRLPFRVRAYLSMRQYDALAARCRELDCTESGAVRAAVARWLELDAETAAKTVGGSRPPAKDTGARSHGAAGEPQTADEVAAAETAASTHLPRPSARAKRQHAWAAGYTQRKAARADTD